MRERAWALRLTLALLLLASLSFAQTFTGTIRGTVTDPTGAIVPGATVTVTDANTGFNRSMTSGSSGEFDFSSLPIGTYRVQVKAHGFKVAVQTGLDLHVNDIKVANFALAIGSASDQVTVEANPVAVETQTGQVAGLVDGTQVRELPMNGRNFMQLTQMAPGVAAGDTFNSTSKGLGGSVNMSVSGSWGNGNLWLVDGANNNDYGSNRTILVYPSIDNIEEFKILRNSYGPEFGGSGGGVVNIATRGGSNNFHGSAYYFGRNDALNARDWFLANADKPIGKLRRNDFGYTFGGPIKKDKLFFFLSQEWNREIRGFTRAARVPTLQEKQGIFTGCVTTAKPIDPLTGAAIPQLGTLNPAGQAYLKIFPNPNTADPCASTNWIQSVGSSDNWREESIRGDYIINQNHTLMVRFSNDSWINPSPNAGGYFGLWGDDPFPVIESSWSQPSRSLSAKLTSTFGSSLVNEFQFSWSYNAIQNTFGGDQSLNDAINTAIPAIFASDKAAGKNLAYPVYWGSPYGNLWSEAPWRNRERLINFRDGVSKVISKHTLKTGAFFGTNQKDEMMGGGGFSEAIQFSSTRGPINPLTGRAVGTGTGNWVADILSPGYIFGFGETAKARLGPIRWHDLEFYGGDSWRVHPRLTLEYGFRWSFFDEPYFDNNQISSFNAAQFNPTLNSPCNGLLLPPGSTACSSLGLAGAGFASDRSIRGSAHNLIAPRLGFAWDPTGGGKWAIRGGVGQFFQRERINALLGLGNQAPFVGSTSATGCLSADGKHDCGGRLLNSASAPFTGAFSSGLGSPSFGVATDAHVPNVWQWNMTVERELAKNVKLETSYVGSHGVHQVSAYNANQGGRFNGLGQVWIYADTASSIYHSLQTSFSGRVGHNLQWQGSYTFSKLIADSSMNWFGEIQNGKADAITNINNTGLDRGLSQMNRPHVFALNVIYNLPRFDSFHPFVKHSIGGWEVATILTAGTGNSVSVFNGPSNDIAGTGTADNQRPNLVPGQSCHASGSDPAQILNPAAFTTAGLGTGVFGNAPRGVCLGPGYNNVDLAIYKNFANLFGGSKVLPEGMKIQFRLEAFNAFNHAQFQMPVNNNLDNSNFGRATQVRPGREIQYALKFIF